MLKSCYIHGVLEAGCDEAGRGPLAGSVFAAAVVLPEDYSNALLNDSKQLSERQRISLRTEIEQAAIGWSVAEVSAAEIDRLNILNASILAMHRALDGLCVTRSDYDLPLGAPLVPEHIIVDGNRWKPYIPQGAILEIPALTVIKGDASYMSIAAASVLAKTYRDEYMLRLHEEYPMYGWDKNKGYPTRAHYEALAQYGPSPYHRQSFRLDSGEPAKTKGQRRKDRGEDK